MSIDKSIAEKYSVKQLVSTKIVERRSEEFFSGDAVRNMFESIRKYVETLGSPDRFTHWKQHSINGYLTALKSMEEFIRRFVPDGKSPDKQFSNPCGEIPLNSSITIDEFVKDSLPGERILTGRGDLPFGGYKYGMYGNGREVLTRADEVNKRFDKIVDVTTETNEVSKSKENLLLTATPDIEYASEGLLKIGIKGRDKNNCKSQYLCYGTDGCKFFKPELKFGIGTFEFLESTCKHSQVIGEECVVCRSTEARRDCDLERASQLIVRDVKKYMDDRQSTPENTEEG